MTSGIPSLNRNLVELETELYERWSHHWDLTDEQRDEVNRNRWLDVDETMRLFTAALKKRRRLHYRRAPRGRNKITVVKRSHPFG